MHPRSLSLPSPDNVAPEQLFAWRKLAPDCRTVSQVYLMFELLHQSIRWSRSTKNVKCRVCRQSTRETEMLLCDGLVMTPANGAAHPSPNHPIPWLCFPSHRVPVAVTAAST